MTSDETDYVVVAGAKIHQNIHCFMLNSHLARCELISNPRARNISPIVDEESKSILLSHEEAGSHALVLDQAFLELLHAVFYVVLLADDPSDIIDLDAIHKRIIFHSACECGRYDLINHLGEIVEISDIFEQAQNFDAVVARLMYPVQFIVTHEFCHWAHSSLSQKFKISEQFVELQNEIRNTTKSSMERVTKYRKEKYGNEFHDQIQGSAEKTLLGVEFWLTDGWEEVVCDYNALMAAIRLGEKMDMPVEKVLSSVNVLLIFLNALTYVRSTILGDEELLWRSSSRTLVWQSMFNHLLSTPKQVQIAQATFSIMNDRLMKHFADPIEAKLSHILTKGAQNQFNLTDAIDLLSRSGFPNMLDGHLSLIVNPYDRNKM